MILRLPGEWFFKKIFIFVLRLEIDFWSNFVDLKLINSGTLIVPQECQLFLLLERFSYINPFVKKPRSQLSFESA